MDSAIIPGYPNYGIYANHTVSASVAVCTITLTVQDMTKFDTDDDGYEAISGELRRWVKELQPLFGIVPLLTTRALNADIALFYTTPIVIPVIKARKCTVPLLHQ